MAIWYFLHFAHFIILFFYIFTHFCAYYSPHPISLFGSSIVETFDCSIQLLAVLHRHRRLDTNIQLRRWLQICLCAESKLFREYFSGNFHLSFRCFLELVRFLLLNHWIVNNIASKSSVQLAKRPEAFQCIRFPCWNLFIWLEILLGFVKCIPIHYFHDHWNCFKVQRASQFRRITPTFSQFLLFSLIFAFFHQISYNFSVQNNLNYLICIKRQWNFCSITYSNEVYGQEYEFQLINLDSGEFSSPKLAQTHQNSTISSSPPFFPSMHQMG